MSVQEVQTHLKDYEMSELKQLLTFFNDSGEIIYDEADCVLRQFVLLDPQFIADFMYFILFQIFILKQIRDADYHKIFID